MLDISILKLASNLIYWEKKTYSFSSSSAEFSQNRLSTVQILYGFSDEPMCKRQDLNWNTILPILT